MTPTEPGFSAELRILAKKVQRSGNFMLVDPASILALLDEVERLTDTEKVLRATIRELEDENVDLNDELGTAVQVLKLERDGLRVEVERLERAVTDGELNREHLLGLLKIAERNYEDIQKARFTDGDRVKRIVRERNHARAQVAKVRELVEGGSFYMAREIFEVVAESRA